MAMTCCHVPSSAHLILLVLVTSQPSGAAPAWGEGGWLDGHTWTHGNEDSLDPFLSLPPISQTAPLSAPLDQGQGEDNPTDSTDSQVLALLLETLDHQDRTAVGSHGGGDWGEDKSDAWVSPGNSEGDEIRAAEGGIGMRKKEKGGAEKGTDQFSGGVLANDGSDDLNDSEDKEEDEKRSEEDLGQLVENMAALAGDNGEDGGKQKGEKPAEREGQELAQLEDQATGSPAPQGDELSLQRKIRGYFKNIDFGLQDNEILPPLKGYKAYNTQLARAGKKLHWQDQQVADRTAQVSNFMDDFENEGGEDGVLEEEEEEIFSRVDEEANARAEKQEVLRQQEEAERAREEEQHLADIASDMLLQYMGKKQQRYMSPRQKNSMGNTAEDKRSEEVVTDADDMDQQMIDRLIEISSKLHLPADDVVEIVRDVEKKKQLKAGQQPPILSPVVPRFRPLVPPPLAAPPIYHYTASKNPKKAVYMYKSNKKWQKDKAKSYKQDYWYKPQKQFLAFPSYPYYQKPYRAYYPVYFPYPKDSFYSKASPLRDQPYGPQDLDFHPHRRRQRFGDKGRGRGWRRQPVPRLPVAPYISNYILPHPRTYQPLPPPPKPLPPARRGRQPPYYYAPVTPDDYEEDGLVPQLSSEEELENFIERIYMKRRMY